MAGPERCAQCTVPPVAPLLGAGLLVTAMLLVGGVRLAPLALDGVDAGRRPDLTYRGADGREHVYLGDYDSYTWLRHARTYLRTGTTCDARVDGICRDTVTHAPLGRRDLYHRSVHIAAIVGLHRAITWIEPGFPLPATAFLVPVIIGVLGVVPAFALGRRLGGELGGWSAAVLIGVSPIFLQRSLGSDNDVWNVVLPLWMVWTGTAALATPSWRRALALTAAAGTCAALHAVTWRGWIFTYGVLLAGVTVHALVLAGHALRTRRPAGAALRRAVAVVVGVPTVAALVTMLAGGGLDGARALPGLVANAIARVRAGSAGTPASAVTWPDVLRTVGELRRPTLGDIAGLMGGPLFFFTGWLGLLLLVLPRRQWRGEHFAVLIGGTLVYRALLGAVTLAPSLLVGVLAAPLLAGVLLRVLSRRPAGDDGEGTALTVVVWFLGALLLACGALRFVMLLVPPFGLAAGTALGRLHIWVDRRVSRPVSALALTLLAALLVGPIRAGYETARTYRPRINSAWWQTLEALRDGTPAEAIVATWWDYGYWAAYVSERRILADGGSLATHIPHWIGRALLAADETEAVGLLRMLACASDATPEPEGHLGAYGQLRAGGRSEAAAHAMVVRLATLDRAAARAVLLADGMAEDAADGVLRATHCEAAPTYLVLSTAMIGHRAWRELGSWDPAETGPRPPSDGYRTLRWRRCVPAADGRTRYCQIDVTIDRAGTRLVAVTYDAGNPETARLHVRRAGGGGEDGQVPEAPPALVLVASEQQLEAHAPPQAFDPDVAVLVDAPQQRVLIGSPDLLRSTFTQLLYLDGRLARRLHKVAEHASAGGERVVTWRMEWGDR